MDVPKYLAESIHELSGGLRCEAEPSPADIGTDHFIVSVLDFWHEPVGITDNVLIGNFTFEQYGVPINMFHQALGVRVVWRSHGSGETWRGKMIEQTRKNSLLFSSPFHMAAFGGKFTGAAAMKMTDGLNNDIPNFEETNKDGPGMAYVVGLARAPQDDRVFEPVIKNKKRNGYIVEQHFTGDVYCIGGDRVPDDARRHTQ